MTNEEKVRAYDEALKDMRVIYPNLRGDAKLAVEHAFPELAESEDERIRKHIIDIIKDNAKSKCIPCGAEIAYLEKQKDLDKMIVVSPEVWDKAISDAFENGKKEGEKQKDFYLSEEDKKIIPEALVMLCDDIINHRMHTPIKTDEEGARKIKAFLKTFNRQPHKTREEWEKQKEPQHAIRVTKGFGDPDGPQFELVDLPGEQKQEWSEEDEKKVAQYLHDRDGGMLWSKATEITRDILDMLRPQPKAELTLLDENIIKAAVAFVEQNDHFNCWGGIDKHTVIKALHSLKPSWKPSEEHFQGLRRAITKADKDSDAERDLKDLYEQPKKLGVKEEPEYYQHFDPDC